MALIPSLWFLLARTIRVAWIVAGGLLLTTILLALPVSFVRYGDIHNIDVRAVVTLPHIFKYLLAALCSLFRSALLTLFRFPCGFLLTTFFGKFLQGRLLALARL